MDGLKLNLIFIKLNLILIRRLKIKKNQKFQNITVKKISNLNFRVSTKNIFSLKLFFQHQKPSRVFPFTRIDVNRLSCSQFNDLSLRPFAHRESGNKAIKYADFRPLKSICFRVRPYRCYLNGHFRPIFISSPMRMV